DIFIRSATDPILFLEFHRQFTHALAFIPLGALICAGVLHPFARKRLSFRESYLFCFLGYATHGLLDACTTYGTQLLWPFSDMRVAWNNVSVVDPLFTLPALVLIILASRWKQPRLARYAMAWAVAYLCLGVVQHERAEAVGRAVAHDRGHDPVRLDAKPGFANLLLWKVVYEVDDHYYVDAVRVGWDAKVYPGEHIQKFDLAVHVPWLDHQSQQARDVERFRWFSNDYLAMDEHNQIGDVRYSVLPNQIKPMWGILLDPNANSDQHVKYFTGRREPSTDKLLDMLLGSH
ncbi:MAG: metal-dependent hydrolase, partial [Deltaproteobacteria bacterium]|nr:metal-dependent hydrolase [Deltaproteobacteria bacterium]